MHRLELEQEIGEGAFSMVYRAKELGSNHSVAVKLFRKKFESWNEACALQEIKTLLQVRGAKNLVQLSEFGREKDGTVYFITPIYDGSLHQLLTEKRTLGDAATSSVLRQVLTGLASMHAMGIVHRDLKPENILYRQVTGEVVVADFGSSAPFRSGEAMSDYITTRFYRSPEMVFNDLEYGAMVDVWAAGCVAFEALAGVPLFPAKGEGDLLMQMCCVLGSPDLSDPRLERMCRNFDTRCIPKQFPTCAPHRWFPGGAKCSPAAVQCVARLVRWIPETRVDCDTALRTEPFLR
ncbi:hypothetical protein BASA81_006499 [Batrachochytrium salamandrivorans]|nr:hypothetical protein BASA81_006499 [Batrachochytrium salamandrivorans]